MLAKRVGIDLGSMTTRLHLKGDGIVAVEPSLVAVESRGPIDPGKVRAVGTAALELPPQAGVRLARPLRDGAIADRTAVEGLVQSLVQRACGRQRIFRPDVMVAVPRPLGHEDRCHILEVCAQTGARSMYLLDAPLAAALGSGQQVHSATGRLVADIGAETVDIAVIASEGAASARCLLLGGASLSDDIGRHLGLVYGARFEPAGIEDVKREIASAVPFAEERTLRVTARRDGVAEEVVVSSSVVGEALGGWLSAVATGIREVLDDAPAPLRDDVLRETGLTLCGGGAQLLGLDRLLASLTGLRVRVAPDPAGCSARGAGVALESLDVLRRTFLYVR